jgi:hypothetical protein
MKESQSVKGAGPIKLNGNRNKLGKDSIENKGLVFDLRQN